MFFPLKLMGHGINGRNPQKYGPLNYYDNQLVSPGGFPIQEALIWALSGFNGGKSCDGA